MCVPLERHLYACVSPWRLCSMTDVASSDLVDALEYLLSEAGMVKPGHAPRIPAALATQRDYLHRLLTVRPPSGTCRRTASAWCGALRGKWSPAFPAFVL